ncbi:MAG: hypothetical protein HWN66_17340 [Candidatus Helarchaeota archaeon]|nr:hypothetical protein [Candidatus Helarchaeota archaeon]
MKTKRHTKAEDYQETGAKFWVLSGNSLENWEKGIKDGIWGVRNKKGLRRSWDRISKGDILIFYVGRPIGGVIGFGRAEAKFKQDKPLWPDEIRANRIIYPFRFEFKTEYSLPKETWHEKKISIRDLKIGYWAGLNPLKDRNTIRDLNARIKESWGVVLEEPIGVGEKPPEYSPNLHNKIKDMIYEIGKIERYISEKEYPLDSERLDVAWRKVDRGVPSRAFEVQIGGDIYHALAKLKHAFDLWNSDLFIIIKDENRPKVEELLAGTFHEVRDRINIVAIGKVQRLYHLQLEHEKLKAELGLV